MKLYRSLYILFAGLTAISCAPVDAYNVAPDGRVNQESVENAVSWINQEVGCNLFTIVQSNHRDEKFLFPRRGRITIQVKPKRVKPGKRGRARWSIRCGARARIFVRYRDTGSGIIAHELGHAVCLDHSSGTFMGKSVPIFWQDGEWQGPVMSDSQRNKLQRKCEEMQDERMEEEESLDI